MSRSVFAKRFQAAFGSTPISFLQGMRLRRAAQHLRQKEETSVEQIARRLGFNSRSHFSRASKVHFGVSPAAFRESLDLR